MTPEREAELRKLCSLEMRDAWREIDSLRQQLAVSELRAQAAEALCVKYYQQLAAKDAEIERLKKQVERLKRCSMCWNDAPDIEPDKDCMCGGAQTRKAQLAGLDGCIQWWRKLHADETLKVHAAEKRAEVCEEVRKSYLDAIHQSAEQERDMRQMVQALRSLRNETKGFVRYARASDHGHTNIAVISQKCDAADAALALPSAQRLMKKGD